MRKSTNVFNKECDFTFNGKCYYFVVSALVSAGKYGLTVEELHKKSIADNERDGKGYSERMIKGQIHQDRRNDGRQIFPITKEEVGVKYKIKSSDRFVYRQAVAVSKAIERKAVIQALMSAEKTFADARKMLASDEDADYTPSQLK